MPAYWCAAGGEWISSIEIENLVMGHPIVGEAAVVRHRFAVVGWWYMTAGAGTCRPILDRFSPPVLLALIITLPFACCMSSHAGPPPQTLTRWHRARTSLPAQVAIPHDKWGERPLLVVVLKHEARERDHEALKDDLYKCVRARVGVHLCMRVTHADAWHHRTALNAPAHA